ncbi:MAG: anti-sigma factor [Candidatus Saccharicenans sp.]|nr:anti-sigma factor [Candidatus Saccharicenans sp.]
MNCKRARSLFSAYLEGALPADLHSDFEAHLTGCSDCSRLLEATRSLAEVWSRLPEVEPPAELSEKLYQIPRQATRLKQEPAAAKKIRFWQFWLNPAFQPVLVSVSVILVFFSLLTFTAPGKSLQKSAALEFRRLYSGVQKTIVKAGVLKDRLDGYRESLMATLEKKNINPSDKPEK